MMNEELQSVINSAFNDANAYGYEYLTVEHLFMSLLKQRAISQLLQDMYVDLDELLNELSIYIEQNTTYLSDDDTHKIPEPTIAFQRVVERAITSANSSEKDEVSNADLLVSIVAEKESYSAYLLAMQGVDRFKLITYLTQHDPSLMNDNLSNSDETDPLTLYTTNLNQLAKDGKIDPLIGRTQDIERVLQTLCRRRKNNPILVGEAGVGKTAIAEGLAWLIEQGNVPDIIQQSTLYSLDMSALIAGTTYRGDFEKRFKELTLALEKLPNSILFIDEIHMIIGAGASGESKLDTANLFKPLLSSGRVRVMGSTTYQEYNRIFEKDRALARRFQKIDIDEPSADDTVKILEGLKQKYQQFHHVTYTAKALRSAVDLSVKYLTDRFLPDKAIDLIDEAGAKNALLPANKRKKTITVKEIEHIIAKMARIPEATVTMSDKTRLQQLSSELKKSVFGQDKAIEVLSDAITLNRAGLGREQKPIGSFLFAGPTGVGKTEIALQLAKLLNIELLRFDMSEYREEHTISRLIGSPPGYVGYEQGGLLTDAIAKHPHAVLLLDEIEKAHPTIYNLLLQIMDHGTLTDSNGRKADFRNAIIIMTTNAGVQDTLKQSIGFNQQDNSTDGMQELNRVFTPEFRNRLDNIIWFQHLSQRIIAQIVDKFIDELKAQLLDKQVNCRVSHSAKAWLATKGYDKSMGARPMTRTIKEHIKKPLAQELLFGQLQHGGNVDITLKEDALVFTYTPK